MSAFLSLQETAAAAHNRAEAIPIRHTQRVATGQIVALTWEAAPCVGDGKHEPVGVGAATKVVVKLALAHIARNGVPLDLPAAVTVLVQVNAAVSALWTPVHSCIALLLPKT